jgi:hypothetical protein
VLTVPGLSFRRRHGAARVLPRRSARAVPQDDTLLERYGLDIAPPDLRHGSRTASVWTASLADLDITAVAHR